MCSPDYSSKIESDNIQNKWRPRTAAALKKESDSWQILPSRVSGIYYEGFDNQGTSDKGIFMSGGHWARVVFKTTKPIRRVEIGCNFDSRKISWKIHLKIGERHFATPLRSGRLSRIEIPVHADIGECRIAILAYPKLGVDPAFLRSAAARFQCHFLRVDFHDATNRRSGRINRSWAGKGAGQAIAFVKDCNEVRRLQLMGGEPLLLKETVDILDHMILSGKAKNITLSLVTNGTIWNGIFAEKLSHFKSAVITVSLDGVGNQYEYIRYGAIWSEVKKNIISMNSMSNTRVWLGPTIQAYNCYSLPELVDFAAKEGLLMRATWLRHPRYLSVVILPPAIKLEMLRQLKEYAAGIASRAIGSDHRYVTFVRRIKTELSGIIDEEADGKAIDELMLYTNDLDGSRSQNIRHACPQLVADLAREGFDWHSRRRHHGQIAHDWEPREPIRELWLKIWRRTRTFVA